MTGTGVAPAPSVRGTRWRLALVTGASRGLGEALARALARRGCDLLLVGRDGAALDAVARDVRTTSGVEAEPTVLDLADESALGDWLAGHAARLSEVDVLVNSATLAETGLAHEIPLAAWRQGLEVGLLAPVRLTAATLPHMLERGGGAVLNVVTSGARNGLPLLGSYSAAKGALWAWSESLSRELSGSGVTVATLVPPHMDSRTSRALAHAVEARYAPGAATGRAEASLADPADVAEAAVASLAAGRCTLVPLKARLTLALNALAPELVAWRVRRVWHGPAGQP